MRNQVQLLFLVMTVVVVGVVAVAEGSNGILVCFSWLLFLLNPPAPKKGPAEIQRTTDSIQLPVAVSR